MALLEQLQSLKQQRDETGMLTIYLNTDFGDGSQHNGEWKIRLKNGLKKLKEYVEKSGTKDELKAFKKAADIADRHIYDQQINMQKSFLLIISSDGEVLAEHILQVPMETEFHWESTPVLSQLESMQKHFPASGIVMVQKSDVHFMDTALGEIRDEKHYSWDVESEDWKQYEGNAASERVPSGSTQVDEVDHRFEENKQRWYKNLAPSLNKEVKNRNLEGIFLVGNTEAIRDMEKHLDVNVLDTVPKNLTSKPSHEVLNTVYGEKVR
ncbi:Protein required for attachment to host cells [Alteribacillus persepolensis]|uniref:Protein required for attachment to host cells n=1 Tax=Alteribacillus persepolensis TaxID=568899 RepID=A0A1G8CAT0_9BACI|nr:VLRF1 family aeRF1-type release factor [Alteribacillus persepolensis]SDH42574.1 Protein required for attachment to host cells [Alteribacillus persepolensis]